MPVRPPRPFAAPSQTQGAPATLDAALAAALAMVTAIRGSSAGEDSRHSLDIVLENLNSAAANTTSDGCRCPSDRLRTVDRDVHGLMRCGARLRRSLMAASMAATAAMSSGSRLCPRCFLCSRLCRRYRPCSFRSLPNSATSLLARAMRLPSPPRLRKQASPLGRAAGRG